jgi:tetratricopeptide (TPR) repeat protein
MKIIRFITLLAVVILNCTNAQTAETKSLMLNNPNLKSGNEGTSKAIADIAELFKNKITIEWIDGITPGYSYFGTQKDVSVFEDRIEFRRNGNKSIVNFSDIIDYDIRNFKEDLNNSEAVFGKYLIEFRVSGWGKRLVDDFVIIQNQLNEKRNASLVLFEQVAAQYHALKVKPPVKEGQRKYIVQGNMYSQEKYYSNAIEMYNKVIEIDQTAYPAAYSNIALLYAQLNNFNAAIYNMKKFLLLEPDASDARSAQDKIYEWEAKTGK